MSKIKLSAFDRYGTFRLTRDEVVGVKNLVRKLGHNEYLSRNAHYYAANWRGRNSCHQLFDEYERLNELLPMSGKPAFVICEKMHELAVRAVNTILEELQMPLFQNGEHFDTVAQICAQECADNLVRLMHDQPAVKVTTSLRADTHLQSETPFDNRIIQADNKKLLYMCANALPDDTEHLITPGRGSSKLGTLVQAVRKHKGLKPLGFTQIRYSLYGNCCQDNSLAFAPPPRVFAHSLKNLPEKVLVMDDDIDTGRTLDRIKNELTTHGHQVTNGAMVATFGDNIISTVWDDPDWAKYIDIIPNQYSGYSDQSDLAYWLKSCSSSALSDFIDHHDFRFDHDVTADYSAMRRAEDKARRLGADLYQVSEKISPAAVAYNTKIRAQVEKYNCQSL